MTAKTQKKFLLGN